VVFSVLAYPDFISRDLKIDASAQGLGTILSQDSTRYPVAYASCALSPSENIYGITNLETLAGE